MTKHAVLVLIPAVLIFLSACTKGTPSAPTPIVDTLPKPAVVHADYDVSVLQVSDQFGISETHTLEGAYLKEISGLVTSLSGKNNLLWALEDSGNKNAIYLLDTLGTLVATKYLTNVFNLDWEDMAGGPGPKKGKYYLYVGDIGDNFKIRPFISVFRLEESDLNDIGDSLISSFDVINLTYPDGAHNAEALLVDSETGDIYVITKDSVAGVYVAPYPQKINTKSKLTLVAELPISTVTAADMSSDGRQILIKNYDDIYYWERKPGETLVACLKKVPLRLNYKKEMQGEAIAWDKEGKSFFTLSEKVGNKIPVLYRYGLTK